MVRSTELETIPPDAQGVAVNRVRFLTAERAEANLVRPSILASWQRSQALQVAADHIEMPYRRDLDADTRLTRNAEPVLSRLHAQLGGNAVSIILTDPTGLVLSRRTTDRTLEQHLDRVLLAPGFSYAEQFVGTNGIGTALESGASTQVFGHEHYAENLERLACAGVPIRDPISGRTVGALDLTCWRKEAESLLLTLAETTAEQIHRALLTDSGVAEYEVLRAYRRTCRRTTGIVFAVTNDAVLLNDRARAELEPSHQAALLAHAGEVGTRLAAGRRRTVEVELPGGATAQLHCEQVGVNAQPAGLIVHVRLAERDTREARARPAATRMLLPGLVGDSPLWQHACRQVEAALTAGSWLVVEGEAGTGKASLLRAVQLRAQPTRRFVVLDGTAADTDRNWPRRATRSPTTSTR